MTASCGTPTRSSKSRNLEIHDFFFRYLVVDDVFITLGEAVLIETFQPLWNVLLSGFRNNPTGGPRSEQAISLWIRFIRAAKALGRSSRSAVREVEELVRTYLEKIRQNDSRAGWVTRVNRATASDGFGSL